MARPSPDPSTLPAWPAEKPRGNLRNSSGSSSAGTPLPWSDTETATCTPSRAALTVIGESPGEERAALESRLPSTCRMRLRSAMTRGSSARETSRPSARTQVTTPSSSCGGWSPSRRPSTMRSASRLRESGAPVRTSKTATPTGEVLTSVSRSARACRSSRWVRALAITSAACEANITSVSSSARVNSAPPSLSPTKTWPTRAPPACLRRSGARGSRKARIHGRARGTPPQWRCPRPPV